MNHLSRKGRVLRAIDHQPLDRVPKGELCIDDRVVGAWLGIDVTEHHHRRQFAEDLGMDLICLAAQYPEPCRFDRLPDADQVGFADIDRWSRETDFFVFVLVDGAFGWGVRCWGFEQFVLKVAKKDPAIATLNRQVEALNTTLAQRVAARGAAGVVLADDIAYNNGLIISPQMLRRDFFPAIARQVQRFHAFGLRAFFHSDGNLNQALGDVVAAGFDGLQCIEEAAGMDLARVRQDHGPRLCLWGNLDPVFVTENLEPGAVEAKVKEVVAAAGDGCGFIFGTSSGLFRSVRPDLVARAYRAAETPAVRGQTPLCGPPY